MAEKYEELINLNKLSQRELLILVATQQKRLESDVKELKDEVDTIRLKVNTLDTKGKVIGGVAGFFAAIAAMIAERLIRP